MPVITATYTPAIGPILHVGVSLPPPAAGAKNAALPKIRGYAALVDTGASSTFISKKVVEDLGLQKMGTTPMRSATATTSVSIYPFTIYLPKDSKNLALGALQRAQVGREYDIPGAQFNAPPTFDILLGRDILCQGDLQMSRDGTFSFSY